MSAPAKVANVANAAARALTYRVPRNANGNLPIYSDIRNGRTRRLVLLTHVQGDINVRLSHHQPLQSRLSLLIYSIQSFFFAITINLSFAIIS